METFELVSVESGRRYRVQLAGDGNNAWQVSHVAVREGTEEKLSSSALSGRYGSFESAVSHAISWAIVQVWLQERPPQRDKSA